MNELMLALEAMITRIVQEQLRVTTTGFEAAVKNAVIDQPWFDEAVRSEAVSAVEGFSSVSVTPLDFSHTNMVLVETIKHAVINNSAIREHLAETILYEVQNSYRIQDTITEQIEVQVSDLQDDHIKELIDKRVEALSFTVSVD